MPTVVLLRDNIVFASYNTGGSGRSVLWHMGKWKEILEVTERFYKRS